ncbi:WD40 repeat-like protein [Paxillus ammoniavirescens]|nr:WD40 repeat-like protein [Paxillus ammoniavirescens]
MSDPSKEALEPTPKPLLTISGHEKSVNGIAYLPGGHEGRLVTCSDDKTVRVWDVENGEEEGMSMEHTGWVQGLAVTRDGKWILTGGWDKILRAWDVETHQLTAEWGGHGAAIRSIALSPDDQLVASGDSEGRIVIREMKRDGQIKHVIETGAGYVNSICFSPDRTRLASGHGDTMVRVFDVENGDLMLGPIKGHTEYVNSVVWSLDARRLFTASWDRSIRFWDCESGEAIREPWTGHTRYVASLSLSSDGIKLASASGDKTVRFWATDSGDPIGEPLQHDNHVWAVTFSPSGKFVACGERSGKVSIWRTPWSDNSKEAHKLLLDLPAVPNHAVVDPDHRLDYVGLPTNRRPSPHHTRLRTTGTTEDLSRTRDSALSWRLWRTLPHRLFRRSHAQPRRAEVTTIYPGFATQRIYVAPGDDDSTADSPTEPMPTTPGHYRGFSIMVESVSSTDLLNEDQPTPVPPVNSEHMQVSCCALFSRRQARSGPTSGLPAKQLPERAVPTSSSPAPPLPQHRN